MARVKIGNVYPTDEYLLARCAPAGYGLGKADGEVVSTPDEALYNGFYNVKNDAYKGDETTTDWRLGWCSLLVERKEGRICQTAKSADLTWYRTSADGGITWEPWEWVNPPMEIGIEYRTTERFMGKPVYKQAISFGALPNATEKIIPYSTPSGTIAAAIKCWGYTSKGISLPHIIPASSITLHASDTGVSITSSIDSTGQTALVVVEYIKEE